MPRLDFAINWLIKIEIDKKIKITITNWAQSLNFHQNLIKYSKNKNGHLFFTYGILCFLFINF